MEQNTQLFRKGSETKYYINVFFEFDIALISVMTLSWCGQSHKKLFKLYYDVV